LSPILNFNKLEVKNNYFESSKLQSTTDKVPRLIYLIITKEHLHRIIH